VSDGCFHKNGIFSVSPAVDTKAVEQIFRHKVLRMLLSKGKITPDMKDGLKTKTFDALEWLAAMCSHVPNKREQMVRYYGYYSNVARGKRKKADEEDKIPCILELALSAGDFRKNWARLIQKIYPVKSPKGEAKLHFTG